MYNCVSLKLNDDDDDNERYRVHIIVTFFRHFCIYLLGNRINSDKSWWMASEKTDPIGFLAVTRTDGTENWEFFVQCTMIILSLPVNQISAKSTQTQK